MVVEKRIAKMAYWFNTQAGVVALKTFIYRALRIISCLSLKVFFKSIETEGQLPSGKYCIVVANHPNAMVDSILIPTLLPWQVAITAKSTFTRRPTYRILMKLAGVVPIFRSIDFPNSLAVRRNTAMIEECVERLSRGEATLIYPEGESHSELRLRPCKRGAALIALKFLKERIPDGQTLDILPVSLFYSHKARFRSSAHVVFGELIRLGREDQHLTPKGLTERIEQRLRDGEMELSGFHERRSLKVLAELIQAAEPQGRAPALSTKFRDMWSLHRRLPLGSEERMQLFRRALRLRSHIRRAKLREEDIVYIVNRSKRTDALWMMALLPFTIVTVLFFSAPMVVTAILASRLTRDYEDWAANQLVPGTILISAYLCLVMILAFTLIPFTYILAVFFLVLFSTFITLSASRFSLGKLSRLLRFFLAARRRKVALLRAECLKLTRDALEVLSRSRPVG